MPWLRRSPFALWAKMFFGVPTVALESNQREHLAGPFLEERASKSLWRNALLKTVKVEGLNEVRERVDASDRASGG